MSLLFAPVLQKLNRLMVVASGSVEMSEVFQSQKAVNRLSTLKTPLYEIIFFKKDIFSNSRDTFLCRQK